MNKKKVNELKVNLILLGFKKNTHDSNYYVKDSLISVEIILDHWLPFGLSTYEVILTSWAANGRSLKRLRSNKYKKIMKVLYDL